MRGGVVELAHRGVVQVFVLNVAHATLNTKTWFSFGVGEHSVLGLRVFVFLVREGGWRGGGRGEERRGFKRERRRGKRERGRVARVGRGWPFGSGWPGPDPKDRKARPSQRGEGQAPPQREHKKARPSQKERKGMAMPDPRVKEG